LLNLTATATAPAGASASGSAENAIAVMDVEAPQTIDVARVPVHQGGTAIAYVKDAVWVEPPSRLFARLLADTVTARTGRVVLSNRQSLMDPGARLGGELRMFGVDEATGEAVVTFDATLMRGEAAVFEKQRFEARVPVSPIAAVPVGAALNQAANQVAAQVADWVGR
jgi:cholesterol transport system auxiliary component